MASVEVEEIRFHLENMGVVSKDSTQKHFGGGGEMASDRGRSRDTGESFGSGAFAWTGISEALPEFGDAESLEDI